jgi:Spx/MgsR family transcriptional regulator
MIQLYGLTKCSTCIKAMAWLNQHNLTHSFTDYREYPIDPGLLQQWAADLGGWEKLVNRASMTWRNLPEERKSPATAGQWLDLIREYPALVRRPVTITAQGQVSVGFSEKKYNELFA